jgi:hypothetical protein
MAIALCAVWLQLYDKIGLRSLALTPRRTQPQNCDGGRRTDVLPQDLASPNPCLADNIVRLSPNCTTGLCALWREGWQTVQFLLLPNLSCIRLAGGALQIFMVLDSSRRLTVCSALELPHNVRDRHSSRFKFLNLVNGDLHGTMAATG